MNLLRDACNDFLLLVSDGDLGALLWSVEANFDVVFHQTTSKAFHLRAHCSRDKVDLELITVEGLLLESLLLVRGEFLFVLEEAVRALFLDEV